MYTCTGIGAEVFIPPLAGGMPGPEGPAGPPPPDLVRIRGWTDHAGLACVGS